LNTIGACAVAIMGTPAKGTATAAVAALPKKRRRDSTDASAVVFWGDFISWVMVSPVGKSNVNVLDEGALWWGDLLGYLVQTREPIAFFSTQTPN
jgi:hypothetical protein